MKIQEGDHVTFIRTGAHVVRHCKFLTERPQTLVEGARWMFMWLALVSMMLLLPGIATTAQGGLLALGLGAALMAQTSWISGYQRRRATFCHDVLDIGGMLGVAAVCPDPRAVVLIVFTSLSFRSLYSTGRRAATRGFLYTVMLGTLFAVRRSSHLYPAMPGLASFLVIVLVLFLMILIVGKYRKALGIREQGLDRDRALAETASLLLTVTGREPTLVVAWAALTEFCIASPEVRVLQLKRDVSGWVIAGSAGEFLTLPTILPPGALSTLDGRVVRILETTQLDRAVGAPLTWECMPLNADQQVGWLLVGVPESIPDEVMRSIRTLVALVTLAVKNSNTYDELATKARVDDLTTLDNRASFTTQLSEIPRRSVRPDSLHLMFIDLDGFKEINDTWGHRVGDEILIEVASRLRAAVRTGDFCSRLGGDEFAVLLRETPGLDAVDLAERLLVKLAAPFVSGGVHISISASIGIATAATGTPIKELVHQADIAMYSAKERGKGQVGVFQPALLKIDRRAGTDFHSVMSQDIGDSAGLIGGDASPAQIDR